MIKPRGKAGFWLKYASYYSLKKAVEDIKNGIDGDF